MLPPSPPAPIPLDELAPTLEAERTELLREVDRLRVKIKRAPKLTEMLDLFRRMGYRRLTPELVDAYDSGRLTAPPPAEELTIARAA